MQNVEHLCNLYDGLLVNHHHKNLFYNLGLVKFLSPSDVPTLEIDPDTQEPVANKIEEMFYNVLLNRDINTSITKIADWCNILFSTI